MPKMRSGFTLIELLIVLAVLGVIAAIAIPNLLNALHRGRQKRTMEDLRAIATACATYAIDRNAQLVQEPAAGVSGIAPHLAPTYLQVMPERDGWGSEFVYLGAELSYTLTSHGRDRRAGGGGAPSIEGLTSDFDCDIVLSDGAFVQYPEGTQR